VPPGRFPRSVEPNRVTVEGAARVLAALRATSPSAVDDAA
jgi:hypothetical protein